ncbi:GL15219 [Drosophila persimilis]|uniref:GL15219 n=1 Tax=Drosophila persimilis TaxID=7234 RepID=B4H3Q4_DROPE|nr:GL15219 [Drosophila persimilis]
MYNGRSRSASRTGPGPGPSPGPILLLTLAGSLLAMQAAAMSLDRLALERNELPAPAPAPANEMQPHSETQPQNDLLVDDMKLASLASASGDSDMYMLVPESVASQLGAADRNTIESGSVADADADADPDADADLPGSSDMLMLESDDTPAMQLVELPSDITVAEAEAEAEAEADAEAAPESQPEVHIQPEMIEEHVVEHSVEGTVATSQKQPGSQEAQLENAEQAVETATETAPVAAPLEDTEEEKEKEDENEEEVVPSNDEPAASPEDESSPATESAADVIAEAVEEVEKEVEQSADPEAASVQAQEEPEQQQKPQEEQESLPEQQQPQEDAVQHPESQPELEPEQEEKISGPEVQAESEAQVVPQVEFHLEPEEQKPSENEVDTTEASLMDSMVEGIEEGLTAAMDHLVPEEIAEATEDKHTEEEEQHEPQKESPPEPEVATGTSSDPVAVEEDQSPATEAAPISEESSTQAAVQPEEVQEAEQEAEQIQILADEPEEMSQSSDVVPAEVEAETEQPQAAVEVVEAVEAVAEEEKQPETVDTVEEKEPQPEAATVEADSGSAADKEEVQNAAEVNNKVEPEAAQPEPVVESKPEVVPETEAETEAEMEVQQAPLEDEAEAEKEVLVEQKPAEVEAEAEPVAAAVVETQPELTAEPSMLTTIIPMVLPQPQAEPEPAQMPPQVADSVLNYVNASFLLHSRRICTTTEEPEDSPFNAHLRRYDGAQVWRIVVQTDKDKRLADELQSKYDGQLWKEVKQEVDYLLKPQVLAAAERHIRAANLSRIVLIDNLQHVIEVENPPAEKIAELQNRKGHRLTWQAYHRLEDIHGFIDYMAKTYPDICSTEIIGYSVEKRPLKILKISNGNARNPGVWIDGGMHAREWISPATVTFIANQLAEGWEDLPEHMRSINWYIHPVANPDGYEYSHTTDRLWRKNMRAHGRQCPGVDLNRNFGYKWGGKGTSASPCSQTYRGSKAFSEPETFYISKFISGFPRETFQAYLSFHSYGQYILYPWGYDYQLTQDRADLDRVARQAGTSITKSTGVKYTVGSSATTLYPAAGGSDDWAKGIAGIKYAYTIEMGDTGRYGFVLPARFIQYNGKDGYTFADTVARAIAQGRGKAVARNSSGTSRRRH